MISRQPVLTTFLLNTIYLTCISFNINKNSSRCSSIILLPWTEKETGRISKNNWKGNVIGPEAPCFFPCCLKFKSLSASWDYLCLTTLLHLCYINPMTKVATFKHILRTLCKTKTNEIVLFKKMVLFCLST